MFPQPVAGSWAPYARYQNYMAQKPHHETDTRKENEELHQVLALQKVTDVLRLTTHFSYSWRFEQPDLS